MFSAMAAVRKRMKAKGWQITPQAGTKPKSSFPWARTMSCRPAEP